MADDLFQGKYYRVKVENVVHGRAYVVVGPEGEDRLFFDVAKANTYAKAKDDKNQQASLF